MRKTKLAGLGIDLGKYWLERNLGLTKTLPTSLTVNVSYHCQSKCKTCNITSRIVNELTISEWKKIFKNYNSKVFWLILSGGEPFLRKEIVEMAAAGYKYLEPAVINIPTNGLLTNIIPVKVEEICKKCPKSDIVINFSMDGIGKDHDRIRGVPGNFEKLLKSYYAAKELKKKYKNLTVGIHSVISVFNVRKIPDLCDYALTLEPDQYLTEIAEERQELKTLGLNITPILREYKKAIDYVSKAISRHSFSGLSKKTESLRLVYYDLVKKTLKEETQVIPCYAGTASGQIGADGEVWSCCVRADNMGNLRDYNYNFSEVWFGHEADRIRKSIKNKECHCPLASATYTNMLFDYKTGVKIAANALSFNKKEVSLKGERPRTMDSLCLVAQIEQVKPFLPSGLDVLDIGCGEGYVDKLLIERNCKVTGIDHSSEAIGIAKKLKGEYICTDIYKYKPSKKFDFILMTEILEHLSDDKKALELVRSWLKPGGQLLISVPGNMPLTKRLAKHAGHFRHYKLNDLTGKVAKAGFKVIKVKEWGALSRRLILTSLPEVFYKVDVKHFYWPVKLLTPFVKFETHVWPFPDSLILLATKK